MATPTHYTTPRPICDPKSGGHNKGPDEAGIMTVQKVQKVGTTIDTPIKMTSMPGGSRITGTFGSGVTSQSAATATASTSQSA